MRQIIDDSNAVFAKAAAAVAALVEQKPDAVIGITEVDMPEAFFSYLRESGVSFAGVTFCNACELAGEAGKGAQSQAAKYEVYSVIIAFEKSETLRFRYISIFDLKHC